MELDVGKNAKKGIAAGLVYKVVTAALPFYIRTLLLRVVGIEFLGIRGLFASILQVLNIAELGFCEAVIFYMYNPIAKNDKKRIKEVLSLYRFIYTVIGCFIFIAGIALIPFLPKLIKGNYPSSINIYYVYLIVLSNTSFSYLVGAYRKALFLAHQRTDITFNVSSIIAVLTGVFEVATIYLTKNIYLYLSVSTTFTIINNLLWVILSNKVYPEYKKIDIKIPFFLIKELKDNIVGVLAVKVSTVVRTAAINIYISVFLGVSVLAIYNNYFLIISTLELFIAVVHTSLLAGLGNRVVNRTTEENYDEFCKINFLYMMLTGVFTACLVCLYQHFMTIWTGEEYLLSFSSVILFSLLFYIKKIEGVEGLYSDANGLYWENKERAIVEAILYIVLGCVLTWLFGINGAIASVIISVFFGLVLPEPIILFKNYFKLSPKLFFKDQFQYLVTSLVMTVISYLICNQISIPGIFGFLVKGIICVAICMISIFLFYGKTGKFAYSLCIIKEAFTIKPHK